VTDSTPFADLPAALVEAVLAQACAAGDLLLEEFSRVKHDRESFREALQKAGLLRHESELGYPPLPTTAATDGSYAIDRLLTTDLAAAAAVAVEGLTPPSETRHWAAPRHSTFVAAEVHHAETATVLRAVMLGRELLLAVEAPHDLVMLDMTLTLPIIYFNQALNVAPGIPGLKCSKEFLEHFREYLDSYRRILWSKRSDKHFISLPKYSTRREVGHRANWPSQHDDRGLLTLLLQPGEFTSAMDLEQPEQEWHLNVQRAAAGDAVVARVAEEIVSGLQNVQVLYYKPHTWLPALRVESSKDVVQNDHRLSTILQGLKHQCATGSMLEPYPLYLADRTVKALARSIPAFRQVATQQISQKYEGNISEVFFAMHGYRSESGR
jgi:hypothetical protein